MRSVARALLLAVVLSAHAVLAGPAPLPAPDLSTIDFRNGADPAPIPSVIGIGPTGKIYVAGAFTNVAAQPRPGIARLNVDGSLDSWNPTLPAVASIWVAAEDASGNVALSAMSASGSPYKTEMLIYVPTSTTIGAIVESDSTAPYEFKMLRFDGPDLYAAHQGAGSPNPFPADAGVTRLRRYLGGTAPDASFSVDFSSSPGVCSFGFGSIPATLYGLDFNGAFVYVAWNRGVLRLAKADGSVDMT